MLYDTAIIGGGPAGLSAALALANAKRTTALFDSGDEFRNSDLPDNGGMTAVPLWQGRSPQEYREAVKADLAGMDPAPVIHRDTVTAITHHAAPTPDTWPHWVLTTAAGKTHTSKTLVLACGTTDILPAQLPGLGALWGGAVRHPLYFFGLGKQAERVGFLVPEDFSMGDYAEFNTVLCIAMHARRFAARVVVLRLGREEDIAFGEAELAALREKGLELEMEPVVDVAGLAESKGVKVTLADGRTLDLACLLYPSSTDSRQPCVDALAGKFELAMSSQLDVKAVDVLQATSTPGVFVAGDVARGVKTVACAVATGAMAGAGAHHFLLHRELYRELGGKVEGVDPGWEVERAEGLERGEGEEGGEEGRGRTGREEGKEEEKEK